jgi:hypothetical protein
VIRIDAEHAGVQFNGGRLGICFEDLVQTTGWLWPRLRWRLKLGGTADGCRWRLSRTNFNRVVNLPNLFKNTHFWGLSCTRFRYRALVLVLEGVPNRKLSTLFHLCVIYCIVIHFQLSSSWFMISSSDCFGFDLIMASMIYWSRPNSFDSSTAR